jgi:transcriptional regulator with XRE-family HTH domain
MARKFADLRNAMTAGQKAESERRAGVILDAMDLPELRDLLEVTQEDLAFRLSISQSNVSRLERRDDMLVSTLRQWVAALGGELHILAVFPDGAVPLIQFAEPAG